MPVNFKEFSAGLRSLCDENGREVDKRKAAELFYQMALECFAQSPDRISLIRSAVLLNAAIVRKPDNVEEMEASLSKLCSHLLTVARSSNKEVNLVEKAKDVADDIANMRTCVEIALQEELLQQDALENSNEQLQRINFIKDWQHDIHVWYSSIMKNIMTYCIDVQGPPPCAFALVGMGSLAREEITPYSDFEHVILLENGIKERKDYEILEYFRWVAVMFQFILVNLGETIIPHLNLPHINDPEQEEGNWFFDENTPRGICFDGMVPFACKFALGKPPTTNKPWSTELIKPVKDMLAYLKDDENLKNGYHLSDILTCTCFVAGSKALHEDFRRGVEAELSHMSLALFQAQVQDDVKRFEPIGNLAESKERRQFNLKRVVYRSSTLFISALKRHFCLNSSSNFDVIQELIEMGKIDGDFGRDLMWLVAIACALRLSLYSAKRRYDDNVIEPDSDESLGLHIVQLMGVNTSIKYFQTVLRLQREVCTLLQLPGVAHIQRTAVADKLLACYWLDLENEVFREAVRLSSDTISDDNGHLAIVNAVLLSFANSFYAKKCWDKALRWYSEAEKLKLFRNSTDNYGYAHILNRKAICFLKTREFSTAVQYFNKEVEFRTSSLQPPLYDPDIPLCYLNIGLSHFGLKDYSNAIEVLSTFAEMYQSCEWICKSDIACCHMVTATCFLELGMYQNAIEHFEQELSVRNEQEDEQPVSKDVARCFYNIGYCKFNLSEFKAAQQQFQHSKEVWERGSGFDCKMNVAECLSIIGDCLCEVGNFQGALRHFAKERHVRMHDADKSQRDIKPVLNTFKSAHCYFSSKQYKQALIFFKLTKKILALLGDSSFHDIFANCLSSMAQIELHQRNFGEASHLFREELDFRKKHPGESEGCVAESNYLLGQCILALGFLQQKSFLTEEGLISYESKAMQHFMYAKQIWEEHVDSSFDEKLAHSYGVTGLCLYSMGRYEESLVQLSCQRTTLEKLVDYSTPDVRMAQNYFASAHCFFQLNQNQDALEKFRQAEIIWMQAADNAASQFSLTSCLKMIAECHYASKNYAEALDALHEEQQLTENIDREPVRLKNLAVNCLDRARCYLQLNREDEAEECRAQAITFASRYYGKGYFEPVAARFEAQEVWNASLAGIHMQQSVLQKFVQTENHFRPKHFKNTIDEFAQAMATWTHTRVGSDFWEKDGFDQFHRLLGKKERVFYFTVVNQLSEETTNSPICLQCQQRQQLISSQSQRGHGFQMSPGTLFI